MDSGKNKGLNPEQLKTKISSFCAYQERSEQQVITKLKTWSLSEEKSREILDWLIKEGFVNNRRFAEVYVHSKFSLKKWGKIKIRQGLRRHKIQEDLIEKELARISPRQYEMTLGILANKKKQSLDGSEEIHQKGKVYRYLAGKGFESGLIYKILESKS